MFYFYNKNDLSQKAEEENYPILYRKVKNKVLIIELEDEQPSSSNENTKPTARKCIKHQHSEPLPTSEVAFEVRSSLFVEKII